MAMVMVTWPHFTASSSYEHLCKGKLQQKQIERLFCEYFSNGHPYLSIGPLKLEAVNLQPAIHIFHDVIFDSEIAGIQSLAPTGVSKRRLRLADPTNYKI